MSVLELNCAGETRIISASCNAVGHPWATISWYEAFALVHYSLSNCCCFFILIHFPIVIPVIVFHSSLCILLHGIHFS